MYSFYIRRACAKRLHSSLICELLNLPSCLYCYLYIIQLCIYQYFQEIGLSSLLTIPGIPQIFKLGNDFEHLLLDFNFIFYHLGNPFYKVGEYFCSPIHFHHFILLSPKIDPPTYPKFSLAISSLFYYYIMFSHFITQTQ